MVTHDIHVELGPREAMKYDVVIVGSGPAGLATAIRLKQLVQKKGTDINVCVLEKDSRLGAHILSGDIIDPRGLNELFSNWKELDAQLNQPVPSGSSLRTACSPSWRSADSAQSRRRRSSTSRRRSTTLGITHDCA